MNIQRGRAVNSQLLVSRPDGSKETESVAKGSASPVPRVMRLSMCQSALCRLSAFSMRKQLAMAQLDVLSTMARGYLARGLSRPGPALCEQRTQHGAMAMCFVLAITPDGKVGVLP